MLSIIEINSWLKLACAIKIRLLELKVNGIKKKIISFTLVSYGYCNSSFAVFSVK